MPRRWPGRSGRRSPVSAGGGGRAGGGSGAWADVPVLYGGTETAGNIGDFLAEPSIDGALVGGASLKPDEMSGIVGRAGVTAAARLARRAGGGPAGGAP